MTKRGIEKEHIVRRRDRDSTKMLRRRAQQQPHNYEQQHYILGWVAAVLVLSVLVFKFF